MNYLTERFAARCGVDLDAFTKASMSDQDMLAVGGAGAAAGGLGMLAAGDVQNSLVGTLSDTGRVGSRYQGKLDEAKAIARAQGGQVGDGVDDLRKAWGKNVKRNNLRDGIQGISTGKIRAAGGIGAGLMGAAGLAALLHNRDN